MELKTLFRLAETASLADLRTAVQGFAAQNSALAAPGLDMIHLDRFIAVVPLDDPTDLMAIAAKIIRGLQSQRFHLKKT